MSVNDISMRDDESYETASVHVTKAVTDFLNAEKAELSENWGAIEAGLRNACALPSNAALPRTVRVEYLAAKVAMDSQAIDNLYCDKKEIILDRVHSLLGTIEKTGRLLESFRVYRKAWAEALLHPEGNRPWDEVAIAFIERAGLPVDKVALSDTRVAMSPLQIMAVASLLLGGTSQRWWKQFSSQYRLSFALRSQGTANDVPNEEDRSRGADPRLADSVRPKTSGSAGSRENPQHVRRFRFRRSTRFFFIGALVFYSCFFLLGVWAFCIQTKLRGFLEVTSCLAVAVFFGKKYARQVLAPISYRLDVTHEWVAMRELGSLVVIPYSRLKHFFEEPISTEGAFSGYRFGFVSQTDEFVVFSTQIVGWADAIDMVRRYAPTVVPPSDALESSKILRSLELSPLPAFLTAPPHDSAKAWKAPTVARWYDYWGTYLVVFSLLLYLLIGLVRTLKQAGLAEPWAGLSFLAFLVGLLLCCQISAYWVASFLRRRRITRGELRKRGITFGGPN